MQTDILVFIDWYYPGYKAGGPIRSCMNLVAHLGTRYNFYIVTRNNDYTESKPYIGIETGKWIKGSDHSHIRYLKPDELNASVYKQIIQERNWALIYINSFFSPLFSILPLRVLRRLKSPRIILAPRGMLSPEALRIKAIKKKLYLFYARYSGLFNHVEFQATSPDELNYIRYQFKKARIHLAPNLPAIGKEGRLDERLEKANGKLKLICIGRIAPEKNTAYLFPLLQHLKGQVELTLVGPVYHSAYWESCQESIKNLPDSVHIHYRGAIPNEEALTILKQHHVFITPTLGENFGHGIVESLQNHRPVIVSNRTPWHEGKGLHVIALERPELFREKIQSFLDMDQPTWETECLYAFETASRLLNTADSIKQNQNMFDFK